MLKSNKEHQQILKIANAQDFLNKRGLLKEVDYSGEREYTHNKINSLGYRGEQIDLTDALILGCSQTFGYSLPHEYTWSHILCKNLGISYSNLAFPGSSLQSQVIDAFKYFKEYGNPKVIFACMPFSRIEMPMVDDNIFYRGMMKLKKTKNRFDVNVLDLSAQLKGLVEPDSFAKKPFDFDSIIPIEFACYYNEIFISMLEQYCRSNNIKLHWTYWECTHNLFQDNVAKNHSNFFIFPSESLFAKNYIYKNKKYFEKDSIFKNDNLFYFAEDRLHWGIYQNLCIADYMEKEYTNE